MKRLLPLPVIAIALFLSAACGGDEPAPGAAASNPPAAAPTASTPPAAAPTLSDPTAAPTASESPATREETGESEGNATFPVGAGTHLVLLHSYNSAKRTAVVELARFTSGGASVKDDGSEYTLPVSPSVKVFSTNGGDPDCLDGTGPKTTGSCLAGADWLQKQVRRGELAVTIANTDDFITEISEQYRP